MLSRQICTMLGAGVPIIQTLELLVMSEPIAQAIMTGANSLEIEKLAQQEGMQTLKQSALDRKSVV